VIRVLEERPERAFADADGSMMVQVTEAAKLLCVKRDMIYELHRKGKLHGFRPHPRARLKFLLSDIRAYAISVRILDAVGAPVPRSVGHQESVWASQPDSHAARRTRPSTGTIDREEGEREPDRGAEQHDRQSSSTEFCRTGRAD
jgi:hypothetical protein